MSADAIQLVISSLTTIFFLLLILVTVWKGVNVVPQSDEYVVERFGKYTRTLKAGLNFIVPFLDRVDNKTKNK